MWMAGALLTSLNPPISTVGPAESTAENVLWLSTWVGFGLVGALVVIPLRKHDFHPEWNYSVGRAP